MPTFSHGKVTRLLFNGVELTSFFREHTTRLAMAPSDATVWGDTTHKFVSGITEGSVELNGLFSNSGTSDIDPVLQGVFGQAAPNELTLAPTGSFAIGAPVTIGDVLESSYEIRSPVADIVAVVASMQSTGGLESGRSLHDLAAETATGNGASSVDSATWLGTTGVPTNAGLMAVAQVTAVSGTGPPSLTLTVQHATDNTTWVDLLTFSAMTAVGSQRVALYTNTTVNRYLRARWTISGASPNFTFNVAAVRF